MRENLVKVEGEERAKLKMIYLISQKKLMKKEKEYKRKKKHYKATIMI